VYFIHQYKITAALPMKQIVSKAAVKKASVVPMLLRGLGGAVLRTAQ
jgi:hypothetical protein